MKCFRIGRTPPGLWVNRTPPIRGGVYTKCGTSTNVETKCTSETNLAVPTDDSSSSSSQDSDLGSSTPLSSEYSDVDISCAESDQPAGIRRRNPIRSFSAENRRPNVSDEDEVVVPPPCRAQLRFSADGYTDWAVRQEIDKDRETYPSVDPVVQQNIIRRYQVLHQRVHDEGFYRCRYLEYGKEMVRYTVLFLAFLTSLGLEWYMTSAIFLGLFWVCSHHRHFWSRGSPLTVLSM